MCGVYYSMQCSAAHAAARDDRDGYQFGVVLILHMRMWSIFIMHPDDRQTEAIYTFQFERSSHLHLGKRRTINKLTITGRPAGCKCMHASLSSSAGEETETETERRAKRRVGLTVVTARALPAAAVLYILAS